MHGGHLRAPMFLIGVLLLALTSLVSPSTIYVCNGTFAGRDSGAANGSESNPYDDVAGAISNGQAGDIFLLYEGTYYGAQNQQLEVAYPASFIGISGAASTIFDGEVADNSWFMTISAVEVFLWNITFANGYNKNSLDSSGGALSVYGGAELSVRDCVFVNNSAKASSGAVHLALNATGAAVFEGCAFRDNGLYRPTDSAGVSRIAAAGALGAAGNGSVRLAGCGFEGNVAKTHGAAVLAAAGARLAVEGCTFARQETKYGVISLSGAQHKTVNISNSVFEENEGVAVYAEYSTVSIGGCSFPYSTGDSSIDSEGSALTALYSDVNVTDSQFNGSSNTNDAAVLYLDSSDLALRGCAFADLATRAVYSSAGGRASLRGCAFRRVAGAPAVALASLGARGADIVGCRFHDGTHTTATGGDGNGGLLSVTGDGSSGGVLRLEGNEFAGGYAENEGGLLYLYEVDVTSINNIYSEGVSEAGGGLIYFEANTGAFVGVNDTFSGGRSTKGGGLYVSKAAVRFEGGQVSRCRASREGGFLKTLKAEFSGYNISVEDCSAAEGGGAFSGEGDGMIYLSGGVIANCSSDADAGVILLNADSNNDMFFEGVHLVNNSAQGFGGVTAFSARDMLGPMFQDCLFEDNSANSGGVLYATLSTGIELVNCTMRGNYAEENGGALSAVVSGAALAGCRLEGNRAGYAGGAFFGSGATLSLRDCALRGNDGEEGGAVYLFMGSIHMNNSVFDSNVADRGGAIFGIELDIAGNATVFEANTAFSNGGVLALSHGSTTCTHCIFSYNAAALAGGVVYQQDGDWSVFSHSYFVGNTANASAAIAYYDATTDVLFDHVEAEKNYVPRLTSLAPDLCFGSAVHVSEADTVTVNQSSFDLNFGFYCLGTIYIQDVSSASIDKSHFSNNLAQYGGALYLGDEAASSLMTTTARRLHVQHGPNEELLDESTVYSVYTSTFQNNTAQQGGGALYVTDSYPSGLESNVFSGNKASFGHDISSQAVFFQSSHTNSSVVEDSGSTLHHPPTAYFEDAFGNIAKDQTGTVVALSESDGTQLSGTTLGDLVQGQYTFSDLIVSQMPGQVARFKLYSEVTDEFVQVNITMKACEVGEILISSTMACQRCEYGTFSISRNQTETECHSCPDGAVCYGGSHIKPKRGYWRFTDRNIYLDQRGPECLEGEYDGCSMEPCEQTSACRGDILLNEFADLDSGTDYIKYSSHSLQHSHLYSYLCKQGCDLVLNGLNLSVSAPFDDACSCESKLNDTDSRCFCLSEKFHGDDVVNGELYLLDEEKCDTGYTGTLCNSCDVGWHSTSTPGLCQECPQASILRQLIVVLGVFAILCYGSALVFSQIKSAGQDTDKLSIIIKIFTSYNQLSTVFGQINVEWPSGLEKLFWVQSYLTAAAEDLIAFDCLYSDNTGSFFWKSLFFLVMPLFLVFLPILWAFVSFKLRQAISKSRWTLPTFADLLNLNTNKPINIKDEGPLEEFLHAVGEQVDEVMVDELRARVAQRKIDPVLTPAELRAEWLKLHRKHYYDNGVMAIVILLFILHPTVTSVTFSLFTCKLIGGEFYLAADPDFKCLTDDHWYWMTGLGIPAAIIYVFGIPFLGFRVLRHYKDRLAEPRVKKRYGFLYTGYKPALFWWEMWVFFRKAILVAIVVCLSPLGEVVTITAGVCLGIAALFLHMHFVPYADEELDKLETFSLWAIVISGLCVQFYNSDAVSSSWTASLTFFALIVIVNGVFFIYFLFMVGLQLNSEMRKKIFNIRVIIYSVLQYLKRRMGRIKGNTAGSEEYLRQLEEQKKTMAKIEQIVTLNEKIVMKKLEGARWKKEYAKLSRDIQEDEQRLDRLQRKMGKAMELFGRRVSTPLELKSHWDHKRQQSYVVFRGGAWEEQRAGRIKFSNPLHKQQQDESKVEEGTGESREDLGDMSASQHAHSPFLESAISLWRRSPNGGANAPPHLQEPSSPGRAGTGELPGDSPWRYSPRGGPRKQGTHRPARSRPLPDKNKLRNLPQQRKKHVVREPSLAALEEIQTRNVPNLIFELYNQQIAPQPHSSETDEDGP